MPQRSAGILMFRKRGRTVELFLVHPGGPFWAKKDDGAWSIPKGLIDDNEDPEAAARREFAEETGVKPKGALTPLGTFKQPSGKLVLAWTLEGDCDETKIKSNNFEMEWPPKSGRKASFPEVDRAAWFDPDTALTKITKGQQPIVAALTKHLGI